MDVNLGRQVSGIVMPLGMGYVFWSGQRGREVHGATSNETPIQDVQGTEHIDQLYSSLVSDPYAAVARARFRAVEGTKTPHWLATPSWWRLKCASFDP